MAIAALPMAYAAAPPPHIREQQRFMVRQTSPTTLLPVPTNALPMPYAAAPPPHIREQQRFLVRQVWAWNLRREFADIAAALPHFRFVAFDTEFPECIIRSPTPYLEQSQDTRYSMIRFNVGCLNLVQLGLVLFDADGNLPSSVQPFTGARQGIVWEFNFHFDGRRYPHSPHRPHLHGVDPSEFAALCFDVGLVSRSRSSSRHSVQWVAFGCGYDMGYFLKMLTRRRLPSSKQEFIDMVESMFGKIIDIRTVMHHCEGTHDGLERLAEIFGVARETGYAHQAGSDALLTCRLFLKIKQFLFQNKNENLEKFIGNIHL